MPSRKGIPSPQYPSRRTTSAPILLSGNVSLVSICRQNVKGVCPLRNSSNTQAVTALLVDATSFRTDQGTTYLITDVSRQLSNLHIQFLQEDSQTSSGRKLLLFSGPDYSYSEKKILLCRRPRPRPAVWRSSQMTPNSSYYSL